MSTDNPLHREPWATALKKAGCVNPKTGEPSVSALSRETGIHVSTLAKVISGKTRHPEPETVEAMANGLDVPFTEVAGWIGMSWATHTPYQPPRESALLDPREREAVNEMIRCLVVGKKIDEE